MPQSQTEKCKCPEKKKRKKQEDRTVCHRGTYRQNSKGITYKVLETIPCEKKASAPKSSSRSGSERPKPKFPKKMPTYKDVFKFTQQP